MDDWVVALSAGFHKNYGTDFHKLDRKKGLSPECTSLTFGCSGLRGKSFLLFFNIVRYI